MPDAPIPVARETAPPRRLFTEDRAITTAALLGQVMFLVSVAIGFLAAGSLIGRDLSGGAAIALSFGGFGMLLVQSLAGKTFRTGAFAIGWLFAIALVLGLGLGPALSAYADADPRAITEAAGSTALIVAALGAGGLALDRDLTRWLRPLTYIVFGVVVASLVLLLVGDGGNPIVSLLIGGVSGALIVVDFNYLRRHGTEDDVVLLATGIFISVVNIFLSLLNLFGDE